VSDRKALKQLICTLNRYEVKTLRKWIILMEIRWNLRAFLIAALMVVPLLTSGCAEQKVVQSNEVSPLSYHVPGQANFLDEKDQQPASHQPNYYEFQAPSEKWMSGHGLSTIISAGLNQPGEVVNVVIRAEERDKAAGLISQTIRYKLTERKADSSYIRTVDERNEKVVSIDSIPKYTINLPTQEGTFYFLTAEIIVADKVEDTLLSFIEVPVQQVEVEIKLDQETYPSSGTLTLTLLNKGTTSLFYGLGYGFEQKEGDYWTPIPMQANTAIPAIGLNLKGGNSWEQSIRFVNLKPGLYRVSKRIEATGTTIKKTLFAEFHIK
jgi:hypothetical protein